MYFAIFVYLYTLYSIAKEENWFIKDTWRSRKNRITIALEVVGVTIASILYWLAVRAIVMWFYTIFGGK
jgi:hypothetical protein